MSDANVPPPGPTRRVALEPYTESLARPLEPGEAIEVVATRPGGKPNHQGDEI